jgi:uncharacterized protein YjbJ (UPF0337 family)
MEDLTMEERIDELKGSVKEGAGKLTGDAELEAEGGAEKAVAHAEHTVKGIGDKIKGTVKEGIGKVTGDDAQRVEGAVDQVKGDIERTG